MNEMISGYEMAADLIQARTRLRPTIALVLGSGLGPLADSLSEPTIIPYEDVPGWPPSTVEGHHGRLVIGLLEGVPVLVQQGRVHYYEGYTMDQVTFPVRVMGILGIRTLLLTNAAGGLNPAFRAGDLMMLSDHINFLGMSGANPLMGPNDDRLGPRFPGMAQTYDRNLRHMTREIAAEAGIELHEGVYVGLSGPFFETPAEVRMLRVLGGDAVGMSTVNEALVARHMGMRVWACSSITNIAIDSTETDRDTNHAEVLEIGQVIVPRLTALLRKVVRRL